MPSGHSITRRTLERGVRLNPRPGAVPPEEQSSIYTDAQPILPSGYDINQRKRKDNSLFDQGSTDNLEAEDNIALS